jgi:selenide, water dikinase
LAQVLRPLQQSHPDLIVGLENGDDAAVWRRPNGRALIATVDFFTPIVDDARTWGMIGAANSASDVYAMGGTPLFALNIVAWPRDQLPMSLLGDVLDGASEMARRGGWIVAGGHSVDGPEPMFGQVVIGEANEADLLTNVGAQVGDRLWLTKKLGTGIIATALKRLPAAATHEGGRLVHAYRSAVDAMTTLNDVGSAAAHAAGAHSMTDVTGFGLVGHLHKMVLGSGVAASIDLAALPLHPDVLSLRDDGFVPGGTHRNLEFLTEHLIGGTDAERWIAADPQTSGGLLVALPHGQVLKNAVVIGEVVAGPAGQIVLY